MRRIVKRLAACLILGAITTVLVAWGCALWVHVPHQQVGDCGRQAVAFGDLPSQSRPAASQPPFDLWWVNLDAKPGGVRLTSTWQTDAGSYRITIIDRTNPNDLVPRWANFTRPTAEAGRGEFIRLADARGWPLPAMWSGFQGTILRVAIPDTQFLRETFPDSRVLSGMMMSPAPGTEVYHAGSTRILPLGILWTSFAIDALVFAIGWAVFAALVQFVRSIPIRRLIGLTGLCTALGILTTIVTAQIFARLDNFDLMTNHSMMAVGKRANGYWSLDRLDQPGSTRFKSRLEIQTTPWVARNPPISPDDLLPRWASFAAVVDSNDDHQPFRVVDAWGWPMCALWAGYMVLPDSAGSFRGATLREVTHGIELTTQPSGVDLLMRGPQLIPYGLVWSGLVVDSVVFACGWLVILVILMLPRRWRRKRRIRMGLCPHCAYNLRGAPHDNCPECGRPVFLAPKPARA